MKGVDASHWQGIINWGQTGVDFAIIKCSQGTSFIDSNFATNKQWARNAGILCGFYHFATNKNASLEAEFFVKSVGDIKKGEFLALDSETGQTPQWCKSFLDRVTQLVGFKPLLYINSSTAISNDWSAVVSGNYGLWIASYGLNLPTTAGLPPKIGQWPFYAIWQYSSRGSVSGINGFVDVNYTKMDRATLMKYGKS